MAWGRGGGWTELGPAWRARTTATPLFPNGPRPVPHDVAAGEELSLANVVVPEPLAVERTARLHLVVAPSGDERRFR